MNDLTRPYAFSVRPRHLETLDSYTDRLLAHNFESSTHQAALLKEAKSADNSGTEPQTWAAIVETKTGRGTTRLDFQAAPLHSHADGHTCTFCTAGITNRFLCTLCSHGELVQQHPHFNDNVCLTHHRWVGPMSTPANQITGGPELARADIIFRKLRRNGLLDVPFYTKLRRSLDTLPQPAGLNGSATDAHFYPTVMKVAAALTHIDFQRRFFNPNSTYAQAHTLLTDTLESVLGLPNPAGTRLLWLYFRPTFLSIRESLDKQGPFTQTAPHDFPLRRTVFEQFRAPIRPLETFARYLRPTGDDIITERNFVDVLIHHAATSPSTENARTVPTICRQGHRGYRSQPNLRTQAKKDRDNCPVCEHRTVLCGFSDMATTKPWMALEFHPTLNAPHTPHTVFAGSPDKFWWVCSKGHDFEATASNRSAARSGCPVCLGRVIDARYNTLSVLQPAIASEWHPTFNIKQSLAETTPGSNYLAWWLCGANKHTYQKSVGDRSRGANCPRCPSNKGPSKMTIAKARPDLAAQWHPTRNHGLTPADVLIESRERHYWTCKNDHEYHEHPRRRNIGYGCPLCTSRKYAPGVSDIETRFGDLTSEWHPTKNILVRPEDIVPGTREYWWKCTAHDHEFKQTVRSRDEAGGCPFCPAQDRLRPPAK